MVRWRPSLLFSFGVLSFVLLTAAAVGLTMQIGETQVQRSRDDAEQRARIAAVAAFGDVLRPADLTRNFLPLSPDRRAAYDAAADRVLVSGGLVRLKIWNAQHWIVFSDNDELIGRWFAGDDLLDAALAGESTSTVSNLNRAEELEVRDFGTLLSVYIPVRFDRLGRFTPAESEPVVGAFEIYLPYAPVQAAIDADTRALYLQVAVAFLVLYAVLFRLVFGASRRLRRQAEDNAFQATHDSLTGLPNRRMLAATVDQRLANTAEKDRDIGLALLDLDHFKEINDTLGHISGDGLLIAVAHRLTASMVGCTVARIGGDEFVVVGDALNDDDSARSFGARIHRVLDEPFEVAGIDVCVRASIGLALAPRDGTSTDDLIQHADIAMYVAKRTGALTCVYASLLDHYSPERLGLAAELRGALADGRITVAYQPKLDFRSGEVHELEALVRWHHPDRGMIPPGDFLPIIENTDLIGPLTWEVLEQSAARCAHWRSVGLDVCVAVNLSARTVGDPTLVTEVAAALARHGLPGDAIELELTESAVLGDHARAAEILQALRALGVSLAVDDFGTGYASISYLTTLPLDVLKIDQSFVRDLLNDDTSAAVVAFTLDLARHLGLRVVAEGIEDERTLDRLRSLGCDTAQGYYIAKPMPAEQVEDWIRNWNAKAQHAQSSDVVEPAWTLAGPGR